jgi:glycosyltransferase involved in cell wall biosynthesis
MRIVVHDYGGYPFTLQLADELARRGHVVDYLFSQGVITPKADVFRDKVDIRNSALTPLATTGDQAAGMRRLSRERRYSRTLAGHIHHRKPDVVLSANCSMEVQGAALEAARRVGAAFVFWMQDVYSMAVGRLLGRRLKIAGAIAERYYGRLEKAVARDADAIIPISEEFLPTLKRWNINEDRLFPIDNWAPLETVLPPQHNAWAAEHGLQHHYVVLYSGTLGRKHDPALLIELARSNPAATVVIAAEGVGMKWLRRQNELPTNLRLMPLQPALRLPEMLATADVLVALLQTDASDFSVPSKVLTYLAAGRPIVAAIPRDNPAARAIVRAQAGRVVEPHDAKGFAAAVAQLLSSQRNRIHAGRHARAFAEDHFDIESIAVRFEDVLLTARTARR